MLKKKCLTMGTNVSDENRACTYSISAATCWCPKQGTKQPQQRLQTRLTGGQISNTAGSAHAFDEGAIFEGSLPEWRRRRE